MGFFSFSFLMIFFKFKFKKKKYFKFKFEKNHKKREGKNHFISFPFVVGKIM